MKLGQHASTSNRWVRIGCYLLIVMLLMAVPLVFFFCSKKPTEKKTAIPKIKIHRVRQVSLNQLSKEPLNILLLGSDSRTESIKGLSDSIILIHLNPKEQSACAVAFPRDSRVSIPGHGTKKINSAMSYGGPALTIKTIEDLTGIKIHYYAVTTFLGFARMINNLGGVQITLDQAIRDRWAGADLPAGSQKLTGEQALAFCRSRHIPDGDFARAAHHQDLLLAVFEQERQKKEPQDLFRLINILMNDCETNLSYREVFELARIAVQIQSDHITKMVLPGTVANISGGSYVILDNDELTKTFEKIKAH